MSMSVKSKNRGWGSVCDDTVPISAVRSFRPSAPPARIRRPSTFSEIVIFNSLSSLYKVRLMSREVGVKRFDYSQGVVT